MENKKILLVQLFSNGDCLYATAVARQIRELYPECHLTWAVAGFCKNTLANNPLIDDLMVVDSVAKNDEPAYRKFKKEILQQKKNGLWDEVFFTHLMDSNIANYDGCIRSAIFRGFGKPVTVPVAPVVQLFDDETAQVDRFASTHRLHMYKQVILFEFAPQSGQSKMTFELAVKIAGSIITIPGTAIILSSAKKVNHPDERIIDGSVLSFREMCALTHHCTHLLGCSSGITWISTAQSAKPLPMIQLLNPYTDWVNPVSRDFERFGIPAGQLIEMIDFDETKVFNCVRACIEDFAAARKLYNQPVPLHFKTTRNIVYNLLCYREFSAIFKHLKINREIYGNHPGLYGQFIMGFIIFPFRLTANFIQKKLFRKKK